MAQFRISDGNETVVGTDAGDYVTFANTPGASGDWTVSIDTGGGNDRIDLDAEAIDLDPEAYGNTITGSISTGAGDDRVAIRGLADFGGDTLDTGTGNDRVALSGAVNGNTIHLGTGADRLTMKEAAAP